MSAAERTDPAQRLAIDGFIEEARQVTVEEAADRLGVGGLKAAGIGERVGPCPACGGSDRFAINSVKNAWSCRGSPEGGGRDGIGLAAHVSGFDLKTRDGLLSACAAVLGRAVPDGTVETVHERARRESRLAARKAKTAADRDLGERAEADFRDKERAKARGKWGAGFPLTGLPAISPQRGETDARTAVRRYLTLRLGGHGLPDLPFLRVIAAEPYWHGKDAAGRAVVLHEGPALVAPFIDAAGLVVGCHLTWVGFQLAAGEMPQGRPPSRKGRPILIDPENGAPLPTKKMRGSKRGSLIPLVGYTLDYAAGVLAPSGRDGRQASEGARIVPEAGRHRLVTGEGIENVLAVGIAEGFRPDTLYAAAGDLGNLAGPADPKSGFGHPVLKDRGGKRPLRVQGPVPRADQAPDDAMAVPDQVSEILLVADGDSERWATAAAMLRAERRLGREGRAIATAWPPRGMDFADLLTGDVT